MVQIEDFVQDLHSRLVRRIVSRGRFIRDTTLDAVTNTRLWLNEYVRAFAAIRGLQGVLECPDLNENIREMKTVGNASGRPDRLSGQLRRLGSFAIAPEFRVLLDTLFGVYHLPDQDLTIISFLDSDAADATSTELLTGANWDALMTSIDGDLDTLGSATADFQRLINIFGLTFGEPPPLGAKPLMVGLNAVWPHLSQVWTFRDTAGVLNYSAPSYDLDPTGQVTLAVLQESGPGMFTYLRPALHSVRSAPAAAVPNTLGLMTLVRTATFETSGLRSYTKSEVSGLNAQSGAGAQATQTRRSHHAPFFWSDLALAISTSYSGFAIKAPGVSLIPVTHEFLVSETLMMLEKMWLSTEPVSGRRPG
jgi:hypothetical protein